MKFLPDKLICLFFCGGMVLDASQAMGEDLKISWKFGLNLGFNEGRTSCYSLEHPRNTGVWVGGNGSCQGAWSDIYTQTNLWNPDRQGTWVRLDADFNLNLNGSTRQTADSIKIGNHNLFVESGNFLGRDALLWLGKRSYKYEDLWVLGMPIINQDAPGFGVYNIDVQGMGRIGFAYLSSISNQRGPMQNSLDLRIEDIALGAGRLSVANIYSETGSHEATTGEDKYEPMSGNKFAVLYKLWAPEISAQSAITYGRGLFGGADSTDDEQGPLLDSSGAWRNYTIFTKNYDPDIRTAMQRSYTIRVGQQLSFNPGEQDWSINAGIGWQRVDFGELRFTDGGRIYSRPKMDTYAFVLKPNYKLRASSDLEANLSYLKVMNGLGYRHRIADTGDLQESLQAVDQRLTNFSLTLNLKPSGRGQQKISLYLGYSWWNEGIRRDIGKGRYPERTAGSYAGVSSSWEM